MKKNHSHLLTVSLCLIGLTLYFAFLFQPANAGPKDYPLPVNFIEGKVFRFMGGNAASGKEAFSKLNCNQCHHVEGVEDLQKPKGKRRLNLVLGKEVRFVKRYEDIITAITNPRHVMNEQYKAILSKAELAGEMEPFMPNLSDFMSAKQMIDIVTFLDAAYDAKQASYLPGEK